MLEGGCFATKPGLGIATLQTALARKVPFAWVAADADYSKNPAPRALLHAHARPYVLAVPVTLPSAGPPGKPRQPAVTRAGDLLCHAGLRPAGAPPPGRGLQGAAVLRLDMVRGAPAGQDPAEGFAHHLLIRRSTE